MKTNEVGSSIFLTGYILLANLNFADMLDYGIKAAIGGAIWLGYTRLAKYLDRKNNSSK